MKEKLIEITSTVREHEASLFLQHVAAFREGKTDAHRAEEIRAQDESNGLDSLKRLFDLAHGHSGQSRRVAAFLLGLYNGQRFPFDLTDFRGVDASIFEDMLRVLRLDSRPKYEVHNYFPNGREAFEALANDWNLHKSQWEVGKNGAFAKQIDGYLCFIEARMKDGHIWWHWFIQSGGGWAWRGGEEVKQHAHGKEYFPKYAEQAIKQWFENGGENPHEQE